MDNNPLGGEIARYRKAAGLTQEELGNAAGVSAQAVSRWECGGTPDVALLPAIAGTLGVSIDALFGREEGAPADIEKEVRRWIAAVPEGERLDQLCRLVWAVVGPATARHPEEVMNIHYEDHCETQNVKDGKPVRWLRRTRALSEEGLVLGVHANDLSFVSIWPEPEAGWEAFLEDNGQYRRLFALLARPHCLELLEYLHSKPIRIPRRRYTPGAVARPMGLEEPEVESLINALSELNLLSRTELETEAGVIDSYRLNAEEALVPFLYFARWMLTSGSGFFNFPARGTPVLRGEKWKERGEEREMLYE